MGGEITATLTSVAVELTTAIETAAASIVTAIGTQSASSGISGLGSLGASGASSFASMGGEGATMAMADGGFITEPIVGFGLNSGGRYMLGEAGTEMVVPGSKLGGSQTHVSVGLAIHAIDSKSGVDFLMQHRELLEAQMTNALAGNRSLRRGIKGTW
jgi:hypothetical protein